MTRLCEGQLKTRVSILWQNQERFFYSPSQTERTSWGARSLLHKGQPALLPSIEHQGRDDRHFELVDWEQWDSWEILLTKIRKESPLPVIYSRGTIPVLFQCTAVLLMIRVLNTSQSFSFTGMVIHTRSVCIFGWHDNKRSGGDTATFSFTLGTRSTEIVGFMNRYLYPPEYSNRQKKKSEPHGRSGRGNRTPIKSLDILLTVHLSIIHFSLFPTWYTAFLFTYNICYPLSSTCFRPHRPIIRRSKLYMQPVVFSPWKRDRLSSLY